MGGLHRYDWYDFPVETSPTLERLPGKRERGAAGGKPGAATAWQIFQERKKSKQNPSATCKQRETAREGNSQDVIQTLAALRFPGEPKQQSTQSRSKLLTEEPGSAEFTGSEHPRSCRGEGREGFPCKGSGQPDWRRALYRPISGPHVTATPCEGKQNRAGADSSRAQSRHCISQVCRKQLGEGS